MRGFDSKFVYGESYNRQVKSLLGIEGNIDLAVAFIGSGASKWFRNESTKYRLIVNLSSGATNPAEVKKMQKRKLCIIRQLDMLHAKVIISDTTTIIGSANLSANGVGLEKRETSNLEEAGIVISTTEDVRQWFNELWNRSKEISEFDLIEAQEKWNRRRSLRRGGISAEETKLVNNELSDLFEHSTQFFLCNTNRRQGELNVNGGYELEEEMHRRCFAAAWETFNYLSHMKQVKSGDAILMFAKKVGIIGIGIAQAECESLKAEDADRVDKNFFDTPEWRIPVKWLVWNDDSAYAYNSRNCTFCNITDAHYIDLHKIRDHFLNNI